MKTEDDPVIARVRKARHRISERCGHDPAKLVEYYMKLQERHADRLIRIEEPGQERKAA